MSLAHSLHLSLSLSLSLYIYVYRYIERGREEGERERDIYIYREYVCMYMYTYICRHRRTYICICVYAVRYIQEAISDFILLCSKGGFVHVGCDACRPVGKIGPGAPKRMVKRKNMNFVELLF